MRLSARRPVALGFAALACLALAACDAPRSAGAKDASSPPFETPRIAQPTPQELDPPRSPRDERAWKEVDQLLAEYKLEAAYGKVRAIREAAQAAGNEEELTRALISEVQLRTGLHGYGDALRLLRETQWPKGALWRIVLKLCYAQALDHYSHDYSREIGQRETIDSQGEVDREGWSSDDIYAEAVRALEEVWRLRESLGSAPSERLSEEIGSNDYPREVRGTLRDAVSYLFVDILGGKKGWPPERADEIWALDFPKLLSGDPVGSAKLDLADPSIHPLLKIGAILDDLESWHAAAGQREAELEARLERFQQLYFAFDKKEQRAAIVAELEKLLPRYRDLPWWSVGMATLAEWTANSDQPDAQARARWIATEGAERFPESIGAQQCRYRIASSEAAFLQTFAMLNDGPRKRSLEVYHRNLPALWMRAYRLELEQLLGRSPRPGPGLDRELLRSVLASQKPDHAWKVELPPTPDDSDHRHRTFVSPPIDEVGAYLVVTSAREDFAEESNSVVGNLLVVTKLAIVARAEAGKIVVRVLDGKTGEPVSGATVFLYSRPYRGPREKGLSSVQAVSGADGSAEFASRDAQAESFLVARREGDLAVGLVPIHIYSRWTKSPETEEQDALVFTDRSVYRPGQRIFWKAIPFTGLYSQRTFGTLTNFPMTVELEDATCQSFAQATAATNDFGSAAGVLEIPADARPGAWRVRGRFGGTVVIRIEEDKRPTFEVSLKPPEEPLRLNREAVFKGEARYYFGQPLSAGKVYWRAARTPVFPPEEHQRSVWEREVANGVAELGRDGSFSMRFVPRADEEQKDGAVSYSYLVSADVVEKGGEVRSASRAFLLGLASVQAQVEADEGFFEAGAPAGLRIKRAGFNGEPRPGKGTWRLFALAQPDRAVMPADLPATVYASGYSTPGDRMRPRDGCDDPPWQRGRLGEPTYDPAEVLRSWREAALRASGTLVHDAQGIATLELPRLAPGAYRLSYETVDDFGAKVELRHELLVVAPGMRLALPAALVAARSSFGVGEKAVFLAHSGFPGQPMLLELFQGEKRIYARPLRAGSTPSLVEIPMSAAHRGGFTARLSLVRDWQVIRLEQNISVPSDDRELRVELDTFRDGLRPGGKERWRVTVKGPGGERLKEGEAELLAYMYDRSLDFVAPHVPRDPLDLYQRSAHSSDVRSSARLQNDFESVAIGSGLHSLPPPAYLHGNHLPLRVRYRVGGPSLRGGPARPAVRSCPSQPAGIGLISAAPQGLFETREAPSEPEWMRSDFSETAFWMPQAQLDADGAATIELEVPDSSPSWIVWVHALTRDLKTGSVSREVKSFKELMVRPNLPRFLREGDEVSIKVLVNNAAERQLDGTVDFDLVDPQTQQSVRERFGLQASAASQRFSAPAGGSDALLFPVRVPKGVGQVAVKVVAHAGDSSDGELRPLPILPSRVRMAESRFASLEGKDQRDLRFDDFASGGDPSRSNESLVVTLDSRLFYSALSALTYLSRRSSESTEGALDNLVSTGIIASLYARHPEIAKGASELSEHAAQAEASGASSRLALEETPWLLESDGRGRLEALEPRAVATRSAFALAWLRETQDPSGGFPWRPGGPPSPEATAHVVYGFAKAIEHGVEVPRDMSLRAWAYLGELYRSENGSRLASAGSIERLVFLGYVASSFPDSSWIGDALTFEERRVMLDRSFEHWKALSPYSKSQLALTLERAGRRDAAKLVFDSVMDSAKTTRDEGTFWPPERRAWLWYNDSVATHALALRALTEISPGDPRRASLVRWLMLNRKLNHWSSTRATAEVIYALADYLGAESQLGAREDATVTAGRRTERFVFEADVQPGKSQLVISGDQLDPEAMSTVTVAKSSPGLMFASATWSFSTEAPPAAQRGDLLAVGRSYFKRVHGPNGFVLEPLSEGARLVPGDEVEVHLSLEARHPCEHVHLRDPRAAGLEPTSSSSTFKWDQGLGYYEEVRDSGTSFFFEQLPEGQYTFKYRLRAVSIGSFKVGPAMAQSTYAPELVAYSSGATIEVLSDGK